MQPESLPPTPPTPPPGVPVKAAPTESKEQADDLLESGEHVVTTVHRHLIGIIGIYIETLLGIIAVVALTLILAPGFTNNLSGSSYHLFLGVIVLVVALISLILFVATYIYRQSRLIVSDKSVIQIMQKGLFIRKISRLSMSSVQDVSANHKGILATMFGYGILTIETAGEEDNFVFPWCPNPDMYAEQVLEARQKFVQTLDEARRPD